MKVVFWLRICAALLAVVAFCFAYTFVIVMKTSSGLEATIQVGHDMLIEAKGTGVLPLAKKMSTEFDTWQYPVISKMFVYADKWIDYAGAIVKVLQDNKLDMQIDSLLKDTGITVSTISEAINAVAARFKNTTLRLHPEERDL